MAVQDGARLRESLAKVEGAVVEAHALLVGHKEPDRLGIHIGITAVAILLANRFTDNLVSLALLCYGVWHIWLARALRPGAACQRRPKSPDAVPGQRVRFTTAVQNVAGAITFVTDGMGALGRERATSPWSFFAKCGTALLLMHRLLGWLSGTTFAVVSAAGWLTYCSGVL